MLGPFERIKSAIPCVYLQTLERKTLGEHLFSGEILLMKRNRFETLREHICTSGDKGQK